MSSSRSETSLSVQGFTSQKFERLPGSINGQPFTLADLTDCEVLLLDRCDQTQVDNLVRCKVFIGPCTHSIFIRDCKDCTFSIICKQLRTRDCKRCNVYLHAHTEPIIETSSEMHFAPFEGGYNGYEERLKKVGFSKEVNRWKEVYDFNDQHRTSKNWSIIAPEKRDAPWVVDNALAAIKKAKAPRSAVPAVEVKKGMAVEARFGGGPQYFKGIVDAVRSDGCCQITYEDGDVEQEVPRYRIRHIGEFEPDPDALKQGDRVDCMHGGGSQLFPGKIAKVHANDEGEDGDMGDVVYDVDYDDGDQEFRVKKAFIAAQNVPAAALKMERRLPALISRLIPLSNHGYKQSRTLQELVVGATLK